MSGRRVPCPTCPWRRSSAAGGADIPNFEICKMRRLSTTVGDEDDFRPIMACHYSGEEGTEVPCVGYVVQAGGSNLSVRVMAIEGRGDIEWGAVVEASERLDLWPDFATMLAAYEAAL